MSASSWSPPERLVAVPAALDSPAARVLEAALAVAPAAALLRSPPPAPIGLRGVPVVGVLPDMPQLLRDAGERGLPRAALTRLLPGGPAAWWRLVRTAAGHLREVASEDFRGLVPVLIELERAGLRGVDLRAVALAAPLTDLLLAAGHRDALAEVVAFLRRAGLGAGLETLNLGHLLARLSAWQIRPDFVIGPLNARGFRMKPSPAGVLEAVRATHVPIVAADITAGGSVPLEAAVAYARSQGAASVVIALTDLA